jgi:hypothetical protein
MTFARGLAWLGVAAAVGLLPAGAGAATGYDTFYQGANFGQLGVVDHKEQGNASAVTILPPFPTSPTALSHYDPRKGQVDFIVNNYDRTHDNTQTGDTYLSVTAIIVQKDSATAEPPLVTLYRAPATWWARDWRPRILGAMDEAYYASRNGNDFANTVRGLYRGGDIHKLDAALLGKRFDASPDGRDVYSWDHRDYWDRPPRTVPECVHPRLPCTTKYYLVKFQPNTYGAGGHPPPFYITTWTVRKIYLFTDSPLDQRFHAQYEIDLDAKPPQK